MLVRQQHKLASKKGDTRFHVNAGGGKAGEGGYSTYTVTPFLEVSSGVASVAVEVHGRTVQMFWVVTVTHEDNIVILLLPVGINISLCDWLPARRALNFTPAL